MHLATTLISMSLAAVVGVSAAMTIWYLLMVQVVAPLAATLNALGQ